MMGGSVSACSYDPQCMCFDALLSALITRQVHIDFSYCATSVVLPGLTEARVSVETDTHMDVKKKGNDDIGIIHIMSLWPH